jgi:hypothetical protein
MDEIVPCLTDLIRDWKHEKLELSEIIIHKREDGLNIILRNTTNDGAYVFGYIEEDRVILGLSNQDPPRSYTIHAANPDFFNLLYSEFMSIKADGIKSRPVYDMYVRGWYNPNSSRGTHQY